MAFAALGDIQALLESGRYPASYRLAVERHGPLGEWTGDVGALVFASRLASNLGGDRLSHALVLRARRLEGATPELPDADRANAALFHAYRIQGRRGPFALRRFLQRESVRALFDTDCGAEHRAAFFCLKAHIAAAYRDADAAEECWRQADALARSAWTQCQRAVLLVSADRYQEALEAAQDSLRMRPWYRPSVQHTAQILSLLGKDEEAVALLNEAIDPEVGALECAAVAAQSALLLAELGRPAEVISLLDRYEAFSPLLEDAGRQWLASRRAEALLQLGDLAGSADAAESLVGSNFFYEKTVPRLRDPERQAARHMVHAVPFVRQHERTCAPATLAALTQFWQRPADHAAIAQEICYGGTFDHQERHWGETHGWVVREFRVDWPSTVALIEVLGLWIFTPPLTLFWQFWFFAVWTLLAFLAVILIGTAMEQFPQIH